MLLRLSLVAAALAFAGATAGLGQTIGPGGGPMAPGPSQPRDYTPGGIGPGGVPVAPGPAARDVNIERIGPAGPARAPQDEGQLQVPQNRKAPGMPGPFAFCNEPRYWMESLSFCSCSRTLGSGSVPISLPCSS